MYYHDLGKVQIIKVGIYDNNAGYNPKIEGYAALIKTVNLQKIGDLEQCIIEGK